MVQFGNTVKLGFKERLNKELGNSEPFSVNNMPVHLINILNKLALVNKCATTKKFLITRDSRRMSYETAAILNQNLA